MGFLRRRVTTALLAANAVKPLGGYTGPQGSLFGWTTSDMVGFLASFPGNELAPHLLAATAVDTAQALVRGKATKTSLALSALTGVGLGYLIKTANDAGALAEKALTDSLGDDYRQQLPYSPTADDRRPTRRDIVRPFAIRKPDVEVIRNVSYRDGDRKARVDIFRPAGVDLTDAPVLIEVHGGAWSISDKAAEGQVLLNRMASRGWVCVAVNYRLAPKNPFPAQIIDVKAAIAWTKSHIAEYGGDPSYVVITGGSAGGHLASMAALTPHEQTLQPGFEDADTSVAACVPFYGVYDLAGAIGDRWSVDHLDRFLGPYVFKLDPVTHRAAFEFASPLNQITPDAPDFFVLHGSADTIVPISQGRTFVRRLRDVSDGIVTYLELPLAQHGFDAFGSIRSQHVVRAVERWLEWHRANRRGPADVPVDLDAASAVSVGV